MPRSCMTMAVFQDIVRVEPCVFSCLINRSNQRKQDSEILNDGVNHDLEFRFRRATAEYGQHTYILVDFGNALRKYSKFWIESGI